MTRSAAVRRRPGLLGLDGGGRLTSWIATRGPDLLGRARWWLAASLVALLLAATGLAEAGFPRAVVQASGEGDLTVRTGQLDDAGTELRRKAIIALGIALAAQLGYLAIRFRWTFGAAAVIAVFHDVAILLGLFAWLGKPLDGVFLAALLTVIGYSVNDSVVVFDRIRERLRARTREPLDKLANEACLQTIPRTVNTGLGALFILAALFVFGGDTLTDFALALLVGLGVGTWSSVFVATPLLVAFERRSGQPSRARPASWRWTGS